MRNLARYRQETHARWRALLDELERRDEELAAEYLEHVEGGARYYDSVPNAEDLRAAARSAFQYVLHTLREQPLSAELAAFPREVGGLRARQGIALENLVAAVRSDFVVAWSALLDLARAQDMTVLTVNADLLWRAVDAFAQEVQQGYLEERLKLARASALDQHQCLVDLFADDGPTARDVTRGARVLGLEPQESYRAVATCGDAERKTVVGALEAGRYEFVEHAEQGCSLILLSTAQHRGEQLAARSPEVFAGAACGIGPCVTGLSRVHRSARAARMLAAVADGPTTLHTAWTRLTIEQIASVIGELRHEVMAPLDGAPDCSGVLDTVRVFVQNGSVSQTAAEMYCHRNTVLSRMNRFRELTGLNLRSPRGQTVVQLCLLPSARGEKD